jgi:hypothetical protein
LHGQLLTVELASQLMKTGRAAAVEIKLIKDDLRRIYLARRGSKNASKGTVSFV